jgi:putative ABC transport system permease protein
VSLLRLAATNLLRNPLRSVLTAVGVSIAVLTFLLLRTVVWSYNVASDQALPDRVVTRHKVTFVMPLPRTYADDVRAVPGVRAATWASWWGGREPNHPNEAFTTLAVDPESYFTVVEELSVDPTALGVWKQDRQGAIIGDRLAERFGWEVGDTVTLESSLYGSAWQFHVDGIYVSTRKTYDRETFLFHWDYLNEMVPEVDRERIGWISSRTVGPPTEVARAIDAVFDPRDIQTASADEATFQRSYLAGFSAILTAIDAVSFLILGIMTLILGNTVAMGVRERTSEYGVLRALGFRPAHVIGLVVGEGVALGLVGGLLGLGLALLVVQVGIGRWVEENLAGLFPYFRISVGNAAAAIGLAIGLAAAASALPAAQAGRLRVIEALRKVA